jgi:uncharacterized protein YjbI with pentapeptide repeats
MYMRVRQKTKGQYTKGQPKRKRTQKQRRKQTGGDPVYQGLIAAIKRSDLTYVQQHASTIPDIDFPDMDQATPMNVAIEEYHKRRGRLGVFNLSGNDTGSIIKLLLEQGASGQGKNFNGIDLEAVSLPGAMLNGANFYGAQLENAHLTGAKMRMTNLTEARLIAADLDGAVLEYATSSGANYSGASLVSTKLNESYLKGTKFYGADLTGAFLRGVNLEGAQLRGATMTGIDLEGAHASGANLEGVKLDDANLRGTDLTGANLTRADLDGADLRGADLRGADLTNVDLNLTSLVGAYMDDYTILRGTSFASEDEGVIFRTRDSVPGQSGVGPSGQPSSPSNSPRDDMPTRSSDSGIPVTPSYDASKAELMEREPIGALPKSNTNPFTDGRLTGFDVIQQEDVNYCDYIEADEYNLLLMFGNQVTFIDADTLLRFIYPETANPHNIVYRCAEINEAFMPYPENIIGGPMLNMNAVGLSGPMVPLEYLDEVVDGKHQIFMIEPTDGVKEMPIASLNTRMGGSVVSDNHCQALVNKQVCTVSYVDKAALTAACAGSRGGGKKMGKKIRDRKTRKRVKVVKRRRHKQKNTIRASKRTP